MRSLISAALFNFEWWWAFHFPNRMLPIGRSARALARKIKLWANSKVGKKPATQPGRDFLEHQGEANEDETV